MDGYRIALFLHLCALFAAFGASAVLALVMRRVRAAVTGRDALPWLALGKSAARTFPIAIVALVGSGAYMVQSAWTWSTGWVDVGLAGALLLALLGDRVEGRAAHRVAVALAAAPDAPAGAIVRDPVWWTASLVNPALALGIVFVMTTKPSLAGAVIALAVSVAVGAVAAVPLRRSPVEAPAGRAELG